jgi:hypothetical protein
LKVIIQAILCSITIHIVYFISTMTIGYIRTKRYVPDMEAAWNNVEKLPNRISFGDTISPALYFFSLVIVTVRFDYSLIKANFYLGFQL